MLEYTGDKKKTFTSFSIQKSLSLFFFILNINKKKKRRKSQFIPLWSDKWDQNS